MNIKRGMKRIAFIVGLVPALLICGVAIVGPPYFDRSDTPLVALTGVLWFLMAYFGIYGTTLFILWIIEGFKEKENGRQEKN